MAVLLIVVALRIGDDGGDVAAGGDGTMTTTPDDDPTTTTTAADDPTTTVADLTSTTTSTTLTDDSSTTTPDGVASPTSTTASADGHGTAPATTAPPHPFRSSNLVLLGQPEGGPYPSAGSQAIAGEFLADGVVGRLTVDFGDGTPPYVSPDEPSSCDAYRSLGGTVPHTYAHAGTYTVKVTIVGSGDCETPTSSWRSTTKTTPVVIDP
jgi:hypothetical protein